MDGRYRGILLMAVRQTRIPLSEIEEYCADD